MPKVKLVRNPEQEHIDLRKRMISAKAAMRGYESKKDIAYAIGMSNAVYSRRLNGDYKWSLDDLAALDRVLRFTDAELAQLVRGK